MAELVVALDRPNLEQAMPLARKLAGIVPWMKVGLELYTAEGPDTLRALKDLGFKVFVDLKFHDIPNTVKGAVSSAVRAGADMVNVHALGGGRMIEAAAEGLTVAPAGSAPILLAVTVLTSHSPEEVLELYGRDVTQLALDLAQNAHVHGCNGVVCSALEAAGIKEHVGSEFLCLTPGIRMTQENDDQRRVMSPAQAVRNGSDYLVVGRPITGASDPAESARAVLDNMQSTL